jgi:ABC-type multidrug transport system fused ATPase/permease subunit
MVMIAALVVVAAPLAVLVALVERRLIDEVLLPRRIDLLPATLALYGGLWLASIASSVIAGLLRALLNERVQLRMRERLFAHCDRLALSFSRREHSGRTAALFASDVPQVSGLFGTTIAAAVGALAVVAVGAVAMISLSWQLAAATALTPLVLTLVAARVTHPLRPAAGRAQEKAAELSERLQEKLAGIREVLAFGREQAEALRFGRTLRELQGLRMRIAVIETIVQTAQSGVSLAVTLVIIGFGGLLVIEGQTTLGTLIAMRSLFALVFQPAMSLVATVGSVQKALGAADRLYGFLDETPKVADRAEARPARRFSGAVRFDNVSFAYRPGEAVLDGVSLAIRAGETVALVGPSGGGKSTLLSLIPRFYDPDEGRVLVDETDLRDYRLSDLRSQIGVVFQDTFLFATTVRENIAMARDDAGTTDIIAAAQAANAWEFIERLPQGLETAVGERGVWLSEGEKQRLAIARAILRDPRILILDEPTSALDARSEALLKSALANLTRGRTTLVIAHRLATIQRADRIVVLERGRVVEEGPHGELVRRRGLYREFVDLQVAGLVHGDDGMDGTSLPRLAKA